MSMISGWGGRVRGLFADTKGPWGQGSGGSGSGDSGPSSDEGDGQSGGPWSEPPRRRRSATSLGSNVSSLDEMLRRRLGRFGGGGLPSRPDRSLILWAVLGFILVWLV